jgi:hypothetical protein
MTKEQLRKDVMRLSQCKTVDDGIEIFGIYAEFFFNAIQNHNEPVYTQAEADAKMVLQMMLTKTLHLKGVLEGVTYKAKDGSTLNKIIDPTIVASLIRNIYETTGMFHTIYRNTKSKEEREILYLLWVHAGLKYRQRFSSVVTTQENKEKMEHEQKAMDKIVEEIEVNTLFKSLDEENQKIIKKKIKDKDYLIRFDGKEVVFLNWQELTKIMRLKEGLLDNIYTYFSLYSHPSNVSVFQFANLFKKDNEEFAQLTIFNLKNAFFMLSIFIAEYIKLFPTVLKIFEKLDIRDQIVINLYNRLARDDSYSINDSWKNCED